MLSYRTQCFQYNSWWLTKMSLYEERFKSALKEVAGKLGFQKYRLQYRDIDENIENYFGVLIPVTLIEERSDGEVKMELIVKMPPKKKELRDAGVLEYMYDVETFFYTTLVRHYKSLSRIDLSDLFTECYFYDTSRFEEVIVLKDVCGNGFLRYQGNRFLDFDHVIVSLHSLAQLHALSMILQKNVGDADTKGLLTPYTSDYPHEFMVALKGSLNNNLHIFSDTKYAVFFSTVVSNFDDAVNDSVRKAKRLVYGHGDYWKENIMYKYQKNKPIKACVLDFQTVRLMSPAQDVLSFLLTSTEAKIRRNHYDFFLETYYGCLRQIILEHTLDPDDIYSRSNFNCDLKTVAPYCFVTTNMSFSLWLGLEKDALLKSKHICEQENENNAAILYNQQTMLDIVDDFVALNYYKH